MLDTLYEMLCTTFRKWNSTHTIYIPKKLLSGIRKNVLSIAFDKNNIPSTIQNTPHLLGGLLKGHGGFLSDELLEDFIINLYYYL